MADQRFPLPKLTNHNYQSWKFRMEMLLVREDLWSVIDKPRPAVVTDECEWTKADLKARATIGLCIDDTQTSLVRNCTTAKEAWKALKEYHDKGSEVYLLKKLTHLELSEDGDMEQHLQQFTELLQRIADIGDPIPDKLKVAMLLCSLPDSFDALVTALEQRPSAELTLELVKSKLLAEAEKRRERSGPAAAAGGKALKVEYRQQSRQQRTDGAGGSPETRVCFYCKKPGHLKRNCRSLQKAGNKKQDEAPTNQPKKEDSAKAKKAQNVFDGPLAWLVGNGEDASWFVDSGASRHMTGRRSFFRNTTRDEGNECHASGRRESDGSRNRQWKDYCC